MVELVDARDSKSRAARRVGSNPTGGTTANEPAYLLRDYTFIETGKLNGLDPEAYLRTVIARIADHPAKSISELLPWNIKL